MARPDRNHEHQRIARRSPCPRLAVTAALFGAFLALAACEPEPEAPPPPVEPKPDRAVLTPAVFSDLPGWSQDRHTEALPALLRSCRQFQAQPVDRPLGAGLPGATVADVIPLCSAAALVPAGDSAAARSFFETWFQPYLVANNDEAEGLFTGYYEIELNGALKPDTRYHVPVYRKPDDQVSVDLGEFDPELKGRKLIGRVESGRLKPYFAREAIQKGALNGRGLELVWLDDPLDAFMLHVQGSGRVRLPDGRTARIGYAGNNGHPYRSIGRELIQRGELEAHAASWQGIRAWIEANPDKAAALLAVNRRYIFFDEITGEGPVGAQGVALTAGRSLAVDPRFVPLGLPLWLDTMNPGKGSGPLRRLVVAQDTGSAIMGPVRGDFFWGTGDAALEQAGRMKHRGRYYLLLPRRLANRLASG